MPLRIAAAFTSLTLSVVAVPPSTRLISASTVMGVVKYRYVAPKSTLTAPTFTPKAPPAMIPYPSFFSIDTRSRAIR